MGRPSATTPQGTLDILILKTLATGERHGLGIAQRVADMSRGEFRVPFGTLFPTLHRLEERGWLSSRWDTSDNNRRAKFYALTKAGAKHLARETAEWQRRTSVLRQVLES